MQMNLSKTDGCPRCAVTTCSAPVSFRSAFSQSFHRCFRTSSTTRSTFFLRAHGFSDSRDIAVKGSLDWVGGISGIDGQQPLEQGVTRFASGLFLGV